MAKYLEAEKTLVQRSEKRIEASSSLRARRTLTLMRKKKQCPSRPPMACPRLPSARRGLITAHEALDPSFLGDIENDAVQLWHQTQVPDPPASMFEPYQHRNYSKP